MPENSPEPASAPSTPALSGDIPFRVRYAVLIILAVCAFTFFPALGARDLWAPDEPRFTEVAREMFLSGDYVVPRRNDKVYVKKPPLLFWCVTLLAKIPGRVTEGVARIPSAVAATGLVLVTFLWGRAQLGARAGFLGALMLATAFRFYWNGRYVQTDMLFSFFCTSAVFCLYHAYVRRSVRGSCISSVTLQRDSGYSRRGRCAWFWWCSRSDPSCSIDSGPCGSFLASDYSFRT